MGLKEQARTLNRDIEVLRQQAESTNVFQLKPLLEKMGQKQATLNSILVEAMKDD